jgi:hypothetical protein
MQDQQTPTERLVRAYFDLLMTTHTFTPREGKMYMFTSSVVGDLDFMLRDPSQLPASAVLTVLNRTWIEAQERYVITPKNSDRGMSNE